MKAYLLLCSAMLVLATGCESTECEKVCDRLEVACNEPDSPVCDDECGSAENACSRCFSCLEDNDACEIQPNGPCTADCVGCRE